MKPKPKVAIKLDRSSLIKLLENTKEKIQNKYAHIKIEIQNTILGGDGVIILQL